MSMHKIPLTELEHDGLLAHRLPIGVPSQLSDVFRSGIKWANEHRIAELQAKAVPEGWKLVPVDPPSAMLDEIHLVEDFTYAALTARYKAMLAAAPAPAASPVVPGGLHKELGERLGEALSKEKLANTKLIHGLQEIAQVDLGNPKVTAGALADLAQHILANHALPASDLRGSDAE